jgi:thiamine biosynthesis lipoprotein
LLRLFPETQGVKLVNPGMRLDLGGIGMGFAIDRTLELLRRRGVVSAMIDASGDIGVSAAPPHATGWKIAVAPLDPTAGTAPETLLLAEAAITTSGDAHQGVEIDGRRYSHIVDPRTGLGVEGLSAVTVIARDATTADALATAASVLGPAPGMASIAATPGCSGRFVWREHGKLYESRSPGWPGPFSPALDPLPADPAPPSSD